MSTTLPSGPGADDIAREGSLDPAPVVSAEENPYTRIEVSSRRVDEAVRLSERYYGGSRFRITSPRAPFSFRYASLGDADVSLRLSVVTGRLTGDISRLDDYVATWFRDGTGRITTKRAPFEVEPGQPVVLPSSSAFTLEAPAGRQSLVHLARPFLERVATERHGGTLQPIAFRHDAPLAPTAVASWRQTITAATPVVTDPDAAPLIRMEANLAVARSLLTVFPWQAEYVPEALLVPRLARARAAVEFLQENAHLPITPADAAAAAGMHTRSLQNAFQRHLGTSPTEYLRCIRLDRVRRDLLEHTPKTASVTDVARAWGFGHLGRFASAYQERFGEKPNETLRR
ncbi:helix-turn-helix domain-containing protein [Frondihabitans peucedani]|uniref:HTH araC/xylS-type domain-containing protein n=1 Tax=Frondihabitans peucedani TaxID=598626 RepID=A0ABP8E259_9MICO